MRRGRRLATLRLGPRGFRTLRLRALRGLGTLLLRLRVALLHLLVTLLNLLVALL